MRLGLVQPQVLYILFGGSVNDALSPFTPALPFSFLPFTLTARAAASLRKFDETRLSWLNLDLHLSFRWVVYHALTSKFSCGAYISQNPRYDVDKRQERGKVAYLWEVSGHHSSIRKLPTSQTLESLSRRLCAVEFDKDLAHTRRLFATTTRPGDLEIDNGAELGALISDVLADFCVCPLVSSIAHKPRLHK